VCSRHPSVLFLPTTKKPVKNHQLLKHLPELIIELQPLEIFETNLLGTYNSANDLGQIRN
jgi:hypothetical protein